ASLAPYRGRLFLGHPKIEMSPGPGTVLPQLVHGGPGRAGGGEELGGARGLAFYMQRVALEGPRAAIAEKTGGCGSKAKSRSSPAPAAASARRSPPGSLATVLPLSSP